MSARSLIEAAVADAQRVRIGWVDSDGKWHLLPALISRETRPDCRRSGAWRITVFSPTIEDDNPLEMDAAFHVNFRNLDIPALNADRGFREKLANGLEMTTGEIADVPPEIVTGRPTPRN